jgi:hypothetical protein
MAACVIYCDGMLHEASWVATLKIGVQFSAAGIVSNAS